MLENSRFKKFLSDYICNGNSCGILPYKYLVAQAMFRYIKINYLLKILPEK